MNDRIGTLNADGSVNEYPLLSLAGASYDRSQSTRRISATQFVVLDRGLSVAEQDALIAALKAPVKPVKEIKHDES